MEPFPLEKIEPYFLQCCFALSVIGILVFARRASNAYARKVLFIVNIAVGSFGVYYGLAFKDYAAGIFFAVTACYGIYLCRKPQARLTYKGILSIWLIVLAAVIFAFGVFEGVSFSKETHIQFNWHTRLDFGWYTQWGVFAFFAIYFWRHYTKRSSLLKAEAHANAFGIIVLVFWLTCFGFKAIGASSERRAFVNGTAFDPITDYVYYGFTPNATNRHGFTRLHNAVEEGDFQTIKDLIADGADVNAQASSYWHTTPLISAIQHEHYKAVSYLLEHGADANLVDKNGAAPIHAAVLFSPKGDTRFVSALVEHGANIYLADRLGNQAIHLAASESYGPDKKPFPRLELIEWLVKNGAHINARNKSFETPLHCSVVGANIEAALKLIELGANPTLRDNRGRTPLGYAEYLHDLSLREDKKDTDPAYRALRQKWLVKKRTLIEYLKNAEANWVADR